MDPTLEPIEIEPAFRRIVRATGGDVVTDLTPNPESQNADFLFRPERIIAELKCLDIDIASQNSFKHTAAEIMASTPPSSDGTVHTEAQRRLALLYKKRLERVVEKANRQIRNTATLFGLEDALGVLLLANNNDSSFRFDLIHWSLGRCLHKFSHINLVIYMTLNKLVTVDEATHRAWVEMKIPGRKPIPSEWADRLFKGLRDYIAAERGAYPRERALSPADLLTMQFSRRTPVYHDKLLGDLW